MPRYYIGNIPFGQDDLVHFGVKGMSWGKHIFGPDANTKYANWWKDRKKQVGQAAGAVKKAVSGAASNVGNWATGNKARANVKSAEAAKKTASINKSNAINRQAATADRYKAANTYANGLRSQVNNQANRQRAVSSAVNRASAVTGGALPNMNAGIGTGNRADTPRYSPLEYQATQAQANANRLENQYYDDQRAANDARAAYNEANRNLDAAKDEYGRTLPGMAGKAGDWIGDRASDIGKAVGGAANKAGEWLDDKTYDARKAVGDFFSNEDEKRNAENARRRYEDYQSEYGDPLNKDRPGDWRVTEDEVNRERDNSRNAQQAYENHPMTRLQNAGRWLSDRASDVGDFFSNDDERRAAEFARRNDNGEYNAAREAAINAYENHPMTRLQNAGRWLGDRASDIGNAAGQAAGQAGNWLGDRAFDIGNAAGQVGGWLGDRVANIGDFFGGGGNSAPQADPYAFTVDANGNTVPPSVAPEGKQWVKAGGNGGNRIIQNPVMRWDDSVGDFVAANGQTKSDIEDLIKRYGTRHDALYTGHALMHSDHRRTGTCIIKDISRR